MNTLEEAFKHMMSLIETGFESAEELAEKYDAR